MFCLDSNLQTCLRKRIPLRARDLSSRDFQLPKHVFNVDSSPRNAKTLTPDLQPAIPKNSFQIDNYFVEVNSDEN